jgi:hypothetical protein
VNKERKKLKVNKKTFQQVGYLLLLSRLEKHKFFNQEPEAFY